ncbi:MAG: threonine--tRNA ligase [Polyangiaceae bacterium]|nr:threonine--tRNA ligase [Polyangiaceae bacterium]
MPESKELPAHEALAERGLLTKDIVAVRAGGQIFDLHTPIPSSLLGELEVISDSTPEALPVIRHSAAHVMADAVQRLFPGTQVTIGPAIDQGFYYDFLRPEGPFNDKELQQIEKEMRRIIKANRPFLRETVSRAEAHALFEKMGEKYKLEILQSIPEGESISLYRHGGSGKPEDNWVDLCEGPHVQRTGQLGAIKLLSTGGAYWRGDEKNQMLQRIYGTAFRTQEDLDAHLKHLEDAKARDHRKLGRELELFMFHEYAPAMPFFLPRGASIYRRLVDYIRTLYERYDYQEVITPQIFDQRLFKTSGHLDNYRENMYLPVTTDSIDEPHEHGDGTLHTHPALTHLGQKPMNCPSHCLIFGQRRRSYRELPWRVADFGRLHRYERGGVVHGLARVRSFCQDDAHIFCTPEQMYGELLKFNSLLFEVYRAFGFVDVAVKLALRPEKRVGTDEQWDHAEAVLEKVLLESNLKFERLPGEGAFYGPKLEFHVTDALGRSWQLGTIQVDYALPTRFDLEYVAPDGLAHRPVMLHRAILGSIERFYGMYIEHTAGKFPVWLAHEQAVVVTVSERQAEYAEKVRSHLQARGLRISVDAGQDKLGAKIRNARMMRVPYIVVLGDDEAANGTVTPRSRDDGELGTLTLEAFTERLVSEAHPPKLEEK